MNRNVFSRRPPVAIKKDVEVPDNTPISTTVLDKPYVNPSGKNNPDVMTEYDKLKDRNIKDEKFEYTKETWKTITNESMNFSPDVSSNFVCAKDVREYEKIKSETEIAIEERENERLEELRQFEALKAQNINMQMEDEVCGDDVDDNAVVFNELKIAAEDNDTSDLKTAKDDFNSLLSEISKL